jgi:DNA-binding NarL/FixJ family response regulator
VSDDVAPDIKVLLVDDQPLMRVGFSMVLAAEDGIEVVGEAADGAAAIKQVNALAPDVVLMDVRMPGMDGIEATRRLSELRPATKVIVLTTFDLDEYAFGALKAGASGFLLKDVRPAELVGAIKAVAAGDAAVSPRVTRRMLDMFAPKLPAAAEVGDGPAGAGAAPGDDGEVGGIGALTPRERDVFNEMAKGLTNAEIAAELVVSETTVKTHVASVLTKLGLRDRVHVVVYAYENGLVG